MSRSKTPLEKLIELARGDQIIANASKWGWFGTDPKNGVSAAGHAAYAEHQIKKAAAVAKLARNRRAGKDAVTGWTRDTLADSARNWKFINAPALKAMKARGFSTASDTMLDLNSKQKLRLFAVASKLNRTVNFARPEEKRTGLPGALAIGTGVAGAGAAAAYARGHFGARKMIGGPGRPLSVGEKMDLGTSMLRRDASKSASFIKSKFLAGLAKFRK
jgi:hypothetical protein